MARIFSYSGQRAKTSFKFTDKAFVFSDLSVSKTHFTDKPPFLSDLSVNFWPLWWGFTDKVSIFIDLSVNGSDFAKGSSVRQQLNRCTWPRSRAKRCFLEFARNLRPKCFGEGNRVEYFFNFSRFCSTFRSSRPEFGPDGRQKRDILPGFCLLSRPRGSILKCQVDKKEAVLPFFVYF